MKKLIIGVAFATLLASPALAQGYPNIGSGDVVAPPAVFAPAAQPYAYAPAHTERLRGIRAQALAPDAVYDNGRYVGQDPDPSVQLELRRDNAWNFE